MATIEMPMRSDLAAFDQVVDLEGNTFLFTFRFNDRKKRWVMDIADSDAVVLLNGIVLLTDVNITDQYIIEGLPPGRFFVIDETGEAKNPEENDLGNDVKLHYLESS